MKRILYISCISLVCLNMYGWWAEEWTIEALQEIQADGLRRRHQGGQDMSDNDEHKEPVKRGNVKKISPAQRCEAYCTGACCLVAFATGVAVVGKALYADYGSHAKQA